MRIDLTKLNIIFIILVPIVANHYYGSIGVFPIDTFAFFDSSNLINKGFLPIRDYWTSNGFLIDLIQSIFFKIFGVNWQIYLLHSSIVNFLFTFFTYKFLISEGLNHKYSLLYSLCAGILAYPSSGVPFPDHHSIIFSIIAIYFFVFSIRKGSKFYLFWTIAFLYLAFLSKQVPAAFFIILVTLYLITISLKSKNYKFIIFAIVFSFLLISILFLFLFIFQIGLKNFFIQYISFPMTIGAERSSGINFYFLFKSLINEFKFFSIFIIIIFYQFLKGKEKQEVISIKLLMIFLSFISIINQEMMKNQNIIFFILPILAGIIHLDFENLKERKYLIPILLIIFLNIFITIKYHERFNVNRKFMDIERVDKNNFINGELFSDKLKGLKWITNDFQLKPEEELNLILESIKYLKKNKENSMIITYYQFINSEIDHNIYSPNRWYTSDGVSYPFKSNRYYETYSAFFKQKLMDRKIKKIYTIKPLDEKTFKFMLKSNCLSSLRINKILFQHDITNCFANKKY